MSEDAKKPAPAEKKRGRPTKYTEAIGKELVERLSDGETLTSICKSSDHLPSEKSVREWALDRKHPFSPLYTRARELGYMHMGDETIDIADDGSNDFVERQGRNGKKQIVFDKDAVERSKLRVDTRKWLLSKMLPKVYGDKLDVKHEPSADFRKFLEAAASGKFRRGKVDKAEDDRV